MVTARVFYVLRGSLMSPFTFNNTVETAVPFNMVSHTRLSSKIIPTMDLGELSLMTITLT